MNITAQTTQYEHAERGHDTDISREDYNPSPEEQVLSLAESYVEILLGKGEVVISGQTHTWQEVLDEDLDNILELQRKLHRCYYTLDFKQGAEALREAQQAAVNNWAMHTARDRVGI